MSNSVSLNDHDPQTMLDAIARGGLGDLRFACDFADRIVNTVEREGDFEKIQTGFQSFRARKDYREIDTSMYPLIAEDVCAPPKEKTQLGRFNAAQHPVLYLSASPEVALAEVRALATDMCTLARFKTVRPMRLAKLLKKKSEFPLGWLMNETTSDEDIDEILLYQTADFVSRRVSDADRELHYRTCNLIASAFKERGFDGVVYRTSFWSNGWRENGRSEKEESIRAANVALFDPLSAEPVDSTLYNIDWKRPTANKWGNSI